MPHHCRHAHTHTPPTPPRRAEEPEENLSPEFANLIRELDLANRREKANIPGSTRIDWNKIGVHDYDEGCDLALYVAGRLKDNFMLNECEIFQLACPELNIRPLEGTGSTSDDENDATIPTKSTRKSTACGLPRDPVCFKYRGEWSLEDIVGDFEDPVDGIKPMHRASSDQHKKEVLRGSGLDRMLEFDSMTNESFLRCKGVNRCQKIANILDLGPNKVRAGSEIYGYRIHGGSVTPNMGDVHADLIIYAKADDGNGVYPLMVGEVKMPSMEHLLNCLQWNYYEELGEKRPDRAEPSREEIERAVQVMRELLDFCLAYGLVEIILWDGLSATAIKFDLAEKRTHARVSRKPGSFPSTIGEVGFWCRTTSYESVNLTLSYMMAAIAWRQMKLIKDKKKYEERCAVVAYAGKQLLLKPKELARVKEKRAESRKRLQSNKESGGGKAKRKHRSEGVWAGSTALGNFPKFEFDTVQDGDTCHRVLRMQRAEYTKLFPNVRCHDKSVVVKLLDHFRVGVYWEKHENYEIRGVGYDEFVDLCEDRYLNEVECYERIKRYNRVCKPKIHAPRLLDYGYSYMTDDQGGILLGFYLVLEDLGEANGLDTSDKEEFLDQQDDELDLLETIGIEHGDVADRNFIVRNGQVYVFDFERSELSASQNAFV